MKKNIIWLFLLLIIITSCSLDSISWDKCEENEVSIFDLTKDSLKKTCDYKKKSLAYVKRGDNFDIDFFLKISKIDKDSWDYILNNIDNTQFSVIEKIQIYYILKKIYSYENSIIEYKIWNLDEKYKSMWVSLHRINLAENLLTINYEDSEDDFDWVITNFGPLSYEDVKFLEFIFDLEPERFDSINLVSDLSWWYNVLIDNKSRELYTNIMKKLLWRVWTEASGDVIKRFLNKVEK